jgi:hypothetical protein
MILRPEQLNAISSAMRDQYFAELFLYLRDQYPEKVGLHSDEALAAEVGPLVDEARQYGLDLWRTVTRYVAYRFDFADFPLGERWHWARRTLRRGDLSQVKKIEHIDAQLIGGPLWETETDSSAVEE